MSTTAAAIHASTHAAIASAQASNAQAAAARAKRAECELAMRGFENDGATLQARQHYAQCVQLVHPESAPPQDNTAGVAFAAVFVTTVGFLVLIMVATLLDSRPRKVK